MAKGAVSGYLSKSLFIRGHQCRKSLWLHKHRPELKDPVDEALQARFDSGHAVGALAHQLFPGGVEVPYEGLTHAEQLAMTRKLLAEGRETIYEATFERDGIFVKVDVLHRGAAGWEILEVKEATEVKEVHRVDAAVQLYVLAGAGLDVAKVAIVHIDNTYVRRGDVEVQKLFAVEDITEDARAMQANIPAEVADMRAVIAGAMPTIDIGPQCKDPYECDFHGHCWRHVPEDSVFKISRLWDSKKFDFYRQGIVHQADVPLERLSAKQRHQVESTLKEIDTLKKGEVRAALDGLRYPLCYLDFETVNPPVPLFDGTSPYQQIPFQYSLRVQAQPTAAPEHHEFLAAPGADPRGELVESLLARVPEGATLIAWNAGFERGVLRALAEQFPQHAARIGTLRDAFFDPMALFQARSVYFWRQKGSSSLKDVMPILAPDLSYDDMEVAHGGMAMAAYHAMCNAEGPDELARIRKALLDYCGLDTLAMVRIVERLRELAG